MTSNPRYLGGQWSPETGFQPLDRVSAYPSDLGITSNQECDHYGVECETLVENDECSCRCTDCQN